MEVKPKNNTKGLGVLAGLTADNDDKPEKVFEVSIDKLDAFPNHPFKLYTGDRLDNLVDSIKTYGVLFPVLIKAVGDRYQILAGHNRTNGAKLAGLRTVPAMELNVDDDTAAIIVVETNFRQRDKLLHSERAFGYKMKMEAISHRGQASDRPGVKSRDLIAEEEGVSGAQVQRYISLTELIPEILDMVDEGKIVFNTGVELSFLKKDEQKIIYDILCEEKLKIKLTQAVNLKKISQCKRLESEDAMSVLIGDVSAKKAIKIKNEDIKKYFPENTSEEEIINQILSALEQYRNLCKS